MKVCWGFQTRRVLLPLLFCVHVIRACCCMRSQEPTEKYEMDNLGPGKRASAASKNHPHHHHQALPLLGCDVIPVSALLHNGHHRESLLSFTLSFYKHICFDISISQLHQAASAVATLHLLTLPSSFLNNKDQLICFIWLGTDNVWFWFKTVKTLLIVHADLLLIFPLFKKKSYIFNCIWNITQRKGKAKRNTTANLSRHKKLDEAP